LNIETLNIIGDVAGNYKTLIRLLGSMPAADKTILLGDLVDRGPNSRKVVQFVKNDPEKVIALMGNHEHMLCDFVIDGVKAGGPYCREDWLVNGGGATIRSYLPNASTLRREVTMPAIRDAMLRDAEFLSGLPILYVSPGERENLIVTHAPLTKHPDELITSEELDINVIWNRGKPIHYPGWFQVHGHNSTKAPHWYGQPEPWGVNVDTSRAGILTGIHWPTKEIFHQEYID
jgi:serine/threonine protein phosphatase 1